MFRLSNSFTTQTKLSRKLHSDLSQTCTKESSPEPKNEEVWESQRERIKILLDRLTGGQADSGSHDTANHWRQNSWQKTLEYHDAYSTHARSKFEQ